MARKKRGDSRPRLRALGQHQGIAGPRARSARRCSGWTWNIFSKKFPGPEVAISSKPLESPGRCARQMPGQRCLILYDGPSNSSSSLIRAAQYVRMSTEHQQHSTKNQSEAISRYAEAHLQKPCPSVGVHGTGPALGSETSADADPKGRLN
jgi:hypothetical protein